MAPYGFENDYRETLEDIPEEDEELREDDNEWWAEGPEELNPEQVQLRQEIDALVRRIEDPEIRDDLSQITNLELRKTHTLRHLRLQEMGDHFQHDPQADDLGVGEQMERIHDLAHRKASAKFSTSLLGQGLSGDHLGSLSDEYEALTRGPEHHDKLMKAREMVREKDLDALQEDIDRDLKEGKIPKSWHDLIAREIRMAKVDGTR